MRHHAMRFPATLIASLMLVAVGRAAAGPLEDLDAAYQRGGYASAARIHRQLADQGQAASQHILGLAYHYGRGVKQDDTEAAKWFHKAADQGYPDAQFLLGRCYENGLGVRQDYAEAVKWYRKAADQGHANAQNDLGVAYLKGEGVPQDYAQSVNWFRKSSEQGNANGQWLLGKMYQSGQGVPQNYVQAYMWINIAVGHLATTEDRNVVLKFRDSLATTMSSSEIALAQRLARKCLESNYRECALPSLSSPSDVQLKANGGTLQSAIQLKAHGGTFVVPVQINGAITLDFTVDSGAADVSVPADVFSTLARTGTIRDTDIIAEQTYVLADGSKTQSVTFTIRSLKVGDRVVENVKGSVAPAQGSLLLGQSFLERFKTWSIDNTKHVLLLEPN
jgi:clan AA aspartic protease (TIGR02281 family)